eukprot:TRINITY_DN9382_c0_g1_i17.p4 TRINITY_DN9382_c0_g1~~TRINITY_DN9382_c0_g1_i17.p4  ORF type:complete len:127 (-),score=19.45 TRINITY_DN9382_c0_g1_i17:54-434(-)
MNYVRGLDMGEHKRHISCGVFCLTDSFDRMGSDYYKAFVAYTRLTSWNSVHNNPECVKEIVNEMYWKAVRKIESSKEDMTVLYVFLVVSLVAVVVMLSLLLSVCVKRDKEMKLVPQTESDDAEIIR